MPTKTATNITYSKPTTNAYDLSVIGSEQHAQLSALFKAIANSINDEYSQTKELALLGKYLCDDWGNLFNSEEEAHKHHPAIDSQPAVSGHSRNDSDTATPTSDLSYISVIARSTSRLLDATEDSEAMDMTVTASQAFKQIALIAESPNS